VQLLVDYGFGGLVLGLVLAAVLVLAARMVSSHFQPFELTAAAVVATVAVALLVGWRRRPDALEVAIRADVALRLKQRLSTAWEYMTLRRDEAIAERLAEQAVRARLPARGGLVFPLRVNRWGRLAPVAATALLLVSVLDLSRIQASAPRTVDEQVVDEGQRLSALGREMQARAARDKLPLSARHAGELERLGARMESGQLSRRESLGLLRQLAQSLDKEGRELLAGAANRKPLDAQRAQADARSSAPGGGELTERSVGETQVGDSRALSRYLNDPARTGSQSKDSRDTAAQESSASNEELRAMLENMAQIERARKEQEELQNALSQLRQAQENLGESAAGVMAGRGLPVDDEGDEQDGDGRPSADAGRRSMGESRGASRFGAQSDSSTAAEREPAPAIADPAKSGPILKPQGDIREGESLVTHGQVLPRVNRSSVENVQMKAEFVPQVEEVLSKERYSAPSKELIRRYFLGLSQGADAPRQQPRGGQ
jgi:hypothetical protein